MKSPAADVPSDDRGSSPPSPFAIATKNLGKRFNREWIFRNLTVSFKPGSVYAITGPNGSGKSTLLQVLSSMMPPSFGEITYSVNARAIPPENVYSSIALAAPYMELIDELTLEEHIDFHFRLKKVRDSLTTSEIIDRLYLKGAKDKFIGNFSSGMKQRLKLGLAFYSEAGVLLLDEPGTNLDTTAFSWYRKELEKVMDSRLTVIASNNPIEYPDSGTIINIMDYK